MDIKMHKKQNDEKKQTKNNRTKADRKNKNQMSKRQSGNIAPMHNLQNTEQMNEDRVQNKNVKGIRSNKIKNKKTVEKNKKDNIKSTEKNKKDKVGNIGKNKNENVKSIEKNKQINVQVNKENITQICKYHKKCGGCSYIESEYAKTLNIKQRYVENLLGQYWKVSKIIGMENPYYYRNKVHAAFGRDRKGNVISGIYEEDSHRIINIDKCMIENELADEMIGYIKSLLKSFKIKVYDEDTGFGLLRHILIRTGHVTGQVMVVLVLSSPILPSKNNFAKVLKEKFPQIATIVINVNDKKTSMVLGERDIVIYGKGYIEDILCGKKYRISPQSFYQINSVQTEVLYQKAVEFAGLKGNERVIDAYSGIGTIGMTVSDYAKEVLCVELNQSAVKDAIANAKANQVKNVRFVCDDAGRFMVKMAEQGQKADVVLMDPPRAGSDEKFLSSIVKLGPEKVVYVSCNPETLARDLRYLVKKGYEVTRACPVDMFPFSGHVESVVLLTKVHN